MAELSERQADCRLTTERDGVVVRLVPSGPFDLDHAPTVQRELATAEEGIEGSLDVALDLRDLDHVDGSGAVLLARFLDRIEDRGGHVRIEEGGRPKAARLIGLYRERRGAAPARAAEPRRPIVKLGAAAADPKVEVVDRAVVPALGATILSLHLEPASGEQRLVASVEIRLTRRDRTVQTRILTVAEPVAAELPGTAAAGMARLLRRLAAESLFLVPEVAP